MSDNYWFQWKVQWKYVYWLRNAHETFSYIRHNTWCQKPFKIVNSKLSFYWWTYAAVFSIGLIELSSEVGVWEIFLCIPLKYFLELGIRNRFVVVTLLIVDTQRIEELVYCVLLKNLFDMTKSFTWTVKLESKDANWPLYV